ncbi:MAG TPA: 2-dehydro-3-deoxygalactonokinase [Flavitalea sp.]|nr:2-dehydro-3-deoxygalactonokinase [Flavitalea sp.]
MANFISCDWGSTNLRIRLVQGDTGKVVAEERSDEGIVQTHARWKEQKMEENKRIPFYFSILQKYISKIEKDKGLSLSNEKVIISGMASSTLGMMEIPYKECPFSLEGSGLPMKKILSSREVYLISGVRTKDDIMRGEETLLAGCADQLKTDGFVICPGTHSKHIVVKGGECISFRTYMTGEFFCLLAFNSSLATCIVENKKMAPQEIQKYFLQGVEDSRKGQLLQLSFSVRTSVLLKQRKPEQNFYYLSGLLIGTELLTLPGLDSLFIIGSPSLLEPYQQALTFLFPSLPVTFVDEQEAIIKGQINIYHAHSVTQLR